MCRPGSLANAYRARKRTLFVDNDAACNAPASADGHFATIIPEDHLWKGVPPKIADSSWDLEGGAIEITHAAVANSLFRCVPAVARSCLPQNLVAKGVSQIANLVVRKNGGLIHTASCFFNIGHLLRGAGLLELRLRALKSSIHSALSSPNKYAPNYICGNRNTI